MHFSFKEIFLLGWPILSVLLFCSMLSLTIILERWNFFRKNKLNAQKICMQIESGQMPSNITLAPLVQFVGNHQTASADFLQSGLQNLIRIQMMQAERFISGLGTIASAAPFIGLLGTVIGIIRAFQTISVAGAGGAQAVTGGIAEALVATAVGLIVAIPALVFYNFFSGKARLLNESLDICASALINRKGDQR